MPWTPKRKAMAFSFSLILISTLFLVSAAADTNSVLQPLLRKREYADERSLTHGHTVALGVVVGAFQDETRTRVAGATVTLYRPTDENPQGRQVAQKQTDDQGRAIFELRPGPYWIQVDWNGFTTSHGIRLHEDTRVGVYFDEEGRAHWLLARHQDAERRGDFAALQVRVAANESGRVGPVANATVNVYGADGDLVQTKLTGPRGFAVFQLHQGRYKVEVLWNDRNATTGVPLQGETKVSFLFDSNGEVHIRKSTDGNREPQRTSQDSPRDGDVSRPRSRA